MKSRMIRIGRVFASFALLASLAATAVLAVEQTGEIKGLIQDEKGQPFPGATLTISGANLQGERGASSDAKGEFAFRALPPGVYALKVNAPGFQVLQLDGVVVNIGRTTSIPITLTPGAITEQVTVTGKAPLVDVAHTQTQDNFTLDYLENDVVGSGGRDYLSVIGSTAGVGAGDGANRTVRGSTLGQNVYLVDGVDSTDPVTATFGSNFIYDTIQELQFQTGGFAAEYGRSTGGIVNIVTKSGGNEFSGSLDGRYRDENFLEKGPHFDPSDLDIKNLIGEGTLGGPIVKDKLWFFLGGSYIQADSAGANDRTVRGYLGKYYLGKLTWQVNANNKLIAQVTADPATIDNSDASPLVAPEATSLQDQGSKFWSTQYVGVLSPFVTLHAQAALYTSNLDVTPQRGDVTTIGLVNFDTGELTENAINVQHSDRHRNQANATLAWAVPDLAGEHTFKFGVDYQKLKFLFDSSTPGGEYQDIAQDLTGTYVPLNYNVTNSVGRVKNKGTVIAYFAQDDWRFLPKFTLNAGLRYEAFSYDDDRGREVLSAQLLEPRIGLAWDATGDAKNVFKVYGGIFGDPSLLALPTVLNSRANSTDVFVNENIGGYYAGLGPVPFDVNGDTVIADRSFLFSFGGPGGEVVAHHGHLKATNVTEISAAYERQLNDTSALSLTLVRRRTHDIIEDVFDPALGAYVVDNVPQLRRQYYGAELRYRTEVKKLHVVTSYTWSRSRGNIEYTQSLGTDFDFPSLSTNRFGYLSGDARHVVKLNGYYELPLQFQFGFDGTYDSGTARNKVESATPYGDEFVDARGAARYPDFYQLNLDLRKGFTIGKTELQVIVSVVNALDTEIVTQVSDRAHLEGQALSYQTPRRYEIGSRFRF